MHKGGERRRNTRKSVSIIDYDDTVSDDDCGSAIMPETKLMCTIDYMMMLLMMIM